ncbi:AbrB family transcriptional regulator [Bacillus sinesaloumensis]|uniref:AbrB family transcriptional regulator n=1 Tax=Litchfieldia sinesaloumensis TaxID=1926280 RepID=UPI0009888EDA|nr:AbrB family transcriptional regulator [Bacillus sinesaloumensis]
MKGIGEAYIVSAIGGLLFYLLHFPIPWILGPMTFMIVYKAITHRKLVVSTRAYNGGLATLGIYFGLSFTRDTFITVYPYIIPFLITTILLLTVSVINSIYVTRFIKIDPMTSVFGSIPGGLSEMVAASHSLRANSAMVTIFQTVRLLTVVFLVPFIVTHLFLADAERVLDVTKEMSNGPAYAYLWFGLAVVAGWLLQNKLPAAYVIGPLAVTALLGVLGVSLPSIPPWFLIIAQITVGLRMGNNINLRDLKIGGKYCGVYLVLTMLLVVVSFGFGYLFAIFTDLDLPTAMLSLAPGGIVEMVLTATAIGADPAVVSSLQLIRLLFIIIVVPSFLKWMFTRKAKVAA